MFQLEEQANHQRLKRLYSQNDELNNILKLITLDHKITPGEESTEIDESRLNVISVSSDSIESEDPFSNLVENWNNIDFTRIKSCLLSNIYSTCVTKAINHLEALQISIDKWMNTIDLEKAIPASASSAQSSKILLNLINKKSNFKRSEKPSTKQHLRFSDNVTIDEENSFLSITGKGTEIDLDVDKTQMVVIDKKEPIENLKAIGVLEEVLLLLARLEFERRRSEMLLKREKDNLNTLKTCIENMALKRALEIPLKVQHEHDACITDITELNWHISFNTKAERKLIRKVEIEERLYQHLDEQISTIKKNTPLIEEKIKAESALIDKIYRAQEDVDEFVRKALDKLSSTQERFETANNKANKEREAIKADLAACKRDLNKAKKRLQEAEDACIENAKTLEESAKKLKENLEQEKIESAKQIELRKKNERLNDKNKNIQLDIFKCEKEIEKVTQENEIKTKEIDEMKQKFNDELNKLNEILNKKLDKLDKVLKKIQEKEVDLEEMAKDKADVENKIAKEERNRELLLDERQRSEEELKTATLDLSNAYRVNSNTVAEYDTETRKLETREDGLKKQISDLRKQIGEERQQLSMLITRMNAEVDEYNQAQILTEQKKAHFEKKKIELEAQLSDLIKRVDEIEKVKLSLDKEVEILNKELKKTLEKHNNLETELKNKIRELEPIHLKSNNDYTENKSKLEYMKSHSAEMREKMNDMNNAKKIMAKSIEKTNSEIENFEMVYKELCIQLESSEKLDNDNKTSLKEVLNRTDTYEKNHLKQMENRGEYLNRLKDQLDSYLKLNKELASRYRNLKYNLYNQKLDLMQKIELKLSTYVSMKDKRQLVSLQERMHESLNHYFDLRLRQSEKNYIELKEERNNIGDEIHSLEDLLYQSVNHISQFLHNQMDFSAIRQKAIQKVYKEELIEQQKQQEQMSKKESKKQAKKSSLKNENINNTLAKTLVKAV